MASLFNLHQSFMSALLTQNKLVSWVSVLSWPKHFSIIAGQIVFNLSGGAGGATGASSTSSAGVASATSGIAALSTTTTTTTTSNKSDCIPCQQVICCRCMHLSGMVCCCCAAQSGRCCYAQAYMLFLLLQAASAGKGPICETRTFTKVEDRPVIKEVKTYVREHHPVEKEVCFFSDYCVIEVHIIKECSMPPCWALIKLVPSVLSAVCY